MKSLLLALSLGSLLIVGCAGTQEKDTRTPASDILAAPIVLDEDADLHPGAPGKHPKLKQRDYYVGIFENSSYTPLIDLVRFARKTIDIEIYMMTDRAFRAALRRALRRGVVVRVIKDPDALGETCKYFEDAATLGPKLTPDCADQRLLVEQIRERGGRFVPFDKKALCGQASASESARCFQHGKIMIVDREVPQRRLALVSTGNFNNSNLCDLKDKPVNCNRDYSYVTRDADVIDGLVRVFEDDLNGLRYEDTDSVFTRKATVSPFSKQPLMTFIASAKSRIQVQNQYMKDRDLLEALSAAAKRGVAVEMMLASDCAFGKPKDPAKSALETNYRALEAAGVKLRFFTSRMKQRGKNGYLHAKAIVVDNERAWVGSVNGSSTSLDVNREYGIFFRHPHRVRFLRRTLERDFRHGESETWQEAFECKKDVVLPGEN